MTAKRFKDLGFRLTCIESLLELGKLKREIARVLKIPERDDYYGEDVNPQRLKAVRQVALTQQLLDKIKSVGPDGGDDIYTFVMEYWRGTQQELYVSAFSDVKLLTNLERICVQSTTKKHCFKLDSLKTNKKLKSVDTDYFYLSREVDIDRAVYDLNQRGVVVKLSGTP